VEVVVARVWEREIPKASSSVDNIPKSKTFTAIPWSGPVEVLHTKCGYNSYKKYCSLIGLDITYSVPAMPHIASRVPGSSGARIQCQHILNLIRAPMQAA